MSILNSVLKIFVGDKKKSDLKLLQPIVANVRAFESEISKLSNDELRAKTNYFKQKINEGTLEFTSKITALNEEAHDANVDRKEEIYAEIDNLEDLRYEASEKIIAMGTGGRCVALCSRMCLFLPQSGAYIVPARKAACRF